MVISLLFCRGCQAKNQPLNIFVHELLERRRHLLLGEMWASADGGPPEVTLETSMGPFTVEVVLLLLLLTTGNDTRLRFGLWCRFFGLSVLQMYYKHAPKTCRNFVELSRRGYYDDVKFHRIIKVSVLDLISFLG